jgi:predicted RNase H-like HicB family nuclease
VLENGELMMSRFLVVIEKASNNYSAYSPDLPGCIATGSTSAEAAKNL